MSKEEELAVLRILVSQHMEDRNYYLAARYLSLVEEVESGGAEGAAQPCCY